MSQIQSLIVDSGKDYGKFLCHYVFFWKAAPKPGQDVFLCYQILRQSYLM